LSEVPYPLVVVIMVVLSYRLFHFLADGILDLAPHGVGRYGSGELQDEEESHEDAKLQLPPVAVHQE
jgi:hypothetical protein